MSPSQRPLRGFTLVEALVAMMVMAFGMLALVSMQTLLSRNADAARQRTEAIRFAQREIEQMRAYPQISTNGSNAWADLASSSSALSITPNSTVMDTLTVKGGTTYQMTWSLSGSSSDMLRTAAITTSWTDRANQSQSVTLTSVIAQMDPQYIGALGVPHTGNNNAKLPKNRNLNIPVPAIDLGSGKSGIALGNFSIIFSNDSGYVVQKCDNYTVTSSTTATDLATYCSTYNAYIVAGYVSRSSSSLPWPSGVNATDVTTNGSGGISCSFSDAQNQNSTTTTTLDGYKYYLCVIPVAASNGNWSGTIRLGGVSTTSNLIICRFQYAADDDLNSNQRNVQPYSAVSESIDNQNYYLTTSTSHNSSVSCPTIDTLQTTLHQDCRSTSNYSGNTSTVLASNCPAAVTGTN